MDSTPRWHGYAWSAAAIAACTLAGLAMRPRFDLVNVAMVYLLAVVVVSLRFPRGPAVACAAASVLVFDVLFVPPEGTLTVEDAQYLLTFAIMIAVALVISRLVEQARGEARARAALGAEAEAERLRNTMLASVSHDLRTPLAVIAGASSSLAEGGERMAPAERRELASSIYRTSRELSEQVAKILQMTRLQTGAMALQRDWTSAAEIVEAALARHAESLAQHRVMTDVPADLPLVRADAALVEQALGNLLENAARHTPPGTPVRVRAVRRDDKLVISVEDFGAGPGDEDLERLFGKFERGARDGKGSGVGLGLAICRAIARLHGGDAIGERLDGGGCAFRLVLPLEPEPGVPAEPGD